ncbi:MAG: ANTAR domain-containing protein [Gammaproteobacteria bacterium]|nr:ANTAR domain-containing protein [Gammaproteobacteria bacterium]
MKSNNGWGKREVVIALATGLIMGIYKVKRLAAYTRLQIEAQNQQVPLEQWAERVVEKQERNRA